MKKIPLTHGMFALVDDEDYDWLMQWRWRVGRTRYAGHVAVRGRLLSDASGTPNILMHRAIMQTPLEQDVNHRNRNLLDNQRHNLRNCEPGQSRCYRKIQQGYTSQYKGVHWHVRMKKWLARITYKYERTYLGLFDDEIEAAKAYDEAALALHGEYAQLNFPQEEYEREEHCNG